MEALSPIVDYSTCGNARTHEQIGELDEEFVWENGPGSRFAIGNRHWVVERVSHSEASIYRTRSALY